VAGNGEEGRVKAALELPREQIPGTPECAAAVNRWWDEGIANGTHTTVNRDICTGGCREWATEFFYVSPVNRTRLCRACAIAAGVFKEPTQ
jgi:hypothetical protein